MLRLSPSILDSYRLFVQNNWMTLADIEARIRREPITPTPAMRLGAAIHAIAEQEPLITDGRYCVDGFVIDVPSLNQALEPLRGGVAEVPCSRILTGFSAPILLSGRVDYLHGLVAWEIKTKDKALDPEQYATSLQWQCYAWMLGIPEVRYLLIQMEETDDCWRVKDADTLALYAYDGMERMIRLWTSHLIDHATGRGLLTFLDRGDA